MHYATTYEQMPLNFVLKETGMMDGKHGSIKGSIQEDSYINALFTNIEIVRATAQYRGEALDLAVQYPMMASQRFLEDFSAMLNGKGVVRILVTHSNNTTPELVSYRTRLLEAWQNYNRITRKNKSCAKFVEPMVYDDFRKVYSRSVDEIMKIYSLPMFGEQDKDESEERKC